MTVNRVAIGYLTKDRVDLSRQTVKPLLQPDKFDLFIFDGSTTKEGRALPVEISLTQPPGHKIKIHHDVRGGPDAAIAYALTTMLKGSDYEYVGIIENDVLLHEDWFGPTLALFERGQADGLVVGAASARCYEDRILCQRDGYAVCHNLGAGMQVLTRRAAQLLLAQWRTGLTSENRRLFCQLSGIDIGRYWAFRHHEIMTTADWQADRILASHGLASLALVPSPVEMIGQDPPLHEQGLKLATEPVEWLRDDGAFDKYSTNLRLIDEGKWFCPDAATALFHEGTWTYFPHQMPLFGGVYEGDWRLKWTQGFGPFSWKAGDIAGKPDYLWPHLTIPLSGPVDFLVSGGPDGGKWRLEDLHSGYVIEPELAPEPTGSGFMSLPVPARIPYRTIRLTALSPGLVFYGLRTKEPQPFLPNVIFDFNTLPPV